MNGRGTLFRLLLLMTIFSGKKVARNGRRIVLRMVLLLLVLGVIIGRRVVLRLVVLLLFRLRGARSYVLVVLQLIMKFVVGMLRITLTLKVVVVLCLLLAIFIKVFLRVGMRVILRLLLFMGRRSLPLNLFSWLIVPSTVTSVLINPLGMSWSRTLLRFWRIRRGRVPRAFRKNRVLGRWSRLRLLVRLVMLLVRRRRLVRFSRRRSFPRRVKKLFSRLPRRLKVLVKKSLYFSLLSLSTYRFRGRLFELA